VSPKHCFAYVFAPLNTGQGVVVDREAAVFTDCLCVNREALNDAINSRKKVSFQYFTFNVRKEQKLRHDGYTYVFSPFKLIWNSGS